MRMSHRSMPASNISSTNVHHHLKFLIHSGNKGLNTKILVYSQSHISEPVVLKEKR